MHGTEYQCRGRAILEQFVDEQVGDPSRVSRVREFHFPRECIAMQPVQQLLAVRGYDVELRVVDVTVDEPRHDQLAGMVLDSRIRRQ